MVGRKVSRLQSQIEAEVQRHVNIELIHTDDNKLAKAWKMWYPGKLWVKTIGV